MVDWQGLIREFIILFVVIDPVGSLPVFLYVTAHVPRRLHARLAIRAVVVAAIVLMVFLAGGQILMESIGMRLGSFQIAGGIILFLFALTMIFGESKPESEIGQAERDHLDGAVFPLAMPSIASPGAMLAVVILTDNHRNSLTDQAITAGLLLLVLAFTLGLLLLATKLHKLIGRTGASIISRVMGIILATVAVDSVVGGLTALHLIDVPAAADAPLVAPGG